jgi:hypothetical protein
MSSQEIDALRNEFARSLDRLTDKLDDFTARLEAIARTQAEQARDITHGRCPNPGACVTVAADVQKLDARLTPLENAFREAVGERRARLAIMATISAAAGALGAIMPYVVAFFSK